MAVDVITEIVIARPCEVVAAYAGDPSNTPRWYTYVSAVRWLTPPPLRVGSRLDFVSILFNLDYTYEVTELGLRRMVMSMAQGPFPMETTYTWDPIGDFATRMTLRNRAEPLWFARPWNPALAQALRQVSEKDLARLKRILEPN